MMRGRGCAQVVACAPSLISQCGIVLCGGSEAAALKQRKNLLPPKEAPAAAGGAKKGAGGKKSSAGNAGISGQSTCLMWEVRSRWQLRGACAFRTAKRKERQCATAPLLTRADPAPASRPQAAQVRWRYVHVLLAGVLLRRRHQGPAQVYEAAVEDLERAAPAPAGAGGGAGEH
jgi:hypothetical protein